jgi:hypothetical protein
MNVIDKHTPGPWYYVPRLSASENHAGYLVGCGPTPNQRIAEVIPVDQDGIKGGANARLIAAAPEMLEALQAMVGSYVRFYGDKGLESPPGQIKKALAAIAKATGAEEPK